MGSVADRQNLRVRNRSQIGVDPDAVLRIGRKSGITGNWCRTQSARPHADVKGNRSAGIRYDLGWANLGYGLVVDQPDTQTLEFSAHGHFHARASKITASRPADHCQLGVRPSSLDFTGDFDPSLGATDSDDPHRSASVFP